MSLAGALGVAWVLVQPFVTGPLLFGRTVFTVWLDLLDQGSRLLGLDPAAALWIVLALLAIYLVIGGFVGWMSWDIARLLQVRLGRPVDEFAQILNEQIGEENKMKRFTYSCSLLSVANAFRLHLV